MTKDDLTHTRSCLIWDKDKGCTCCLRERRRITEYEAALQKIKEMVCGEARPRWGNSPETTTTRGIIADVCDAVLTPNAAVKPRHCED